MMQLAAHIMKQKRKPFDVASYKDRYEEDSGSSSVGKTKSLPVMRPAEPKPTNVVSLLDVLRKSLEQEGLKTKGPAKDGKPAGRARPKTAAKGKKSGYTKKEARKA